MTAAAPTPTKDSVTKLFVNRLTRQGRLDEWRSTLANVQAETGKGFGQAKWIAMKKLGYVGPDDERQRHEQWLAGEQAKADAAAEQAAGSNATLIECDEAFESALAQLPLKADRQVENDWIMGHVALTRRARSSDKDAPVRLTGNDVLCASHGSAPSRAAAIRLQLFVDNPDELSKALTAPVKRDDGSESGKDDEVIEDPGIEELKKMLVPSGQNWQQWETNQAIELLTKKGYVITPPQAA